MTAAATNFFSSLEGAFGLSLCFEARPSGYTVDRSSPIYQAGFGVRFVYINRYVAQWGAESGFHSLKRVVMDASTPNWECGAGDSRQKRSGYWVKLYNILNGAPKGWDERFRHTKTISVLKFGGGYGRFNFFELPGVVLPTY